MLTIVIPAAGDGNRFKEAGYDLPKPMIDVVGKPMIERVIENLRPSIDHRFILVSRLRYDDTLKLSFRYDDINISLERQTEGAVDTILKASGFITVGPLLIGNCDQLVDFDVNEFIESAQGHDGSIVTFKSNAPHHSYVTVDSDNVVQSIAEKRVISTQAVTGVYYFSCGTDFINLAKEVVEANDRYNSEFYVSSVIAKMISRGRRFTTFDAPSTMLGTPEELQRFETAIRVGQNVL